MSQMKRALEDEIEGIREELGDDCTVDRLLMELAAVRLTHVLPGTPDPDSADARVVADAVEGGEVMTMRLRGAPATCGDCSLDSPAVASLEGTIKRLRRERDEARATTEAIKTDKNDLVDALTKANKVIEQVDEGLRARRRLRRVREDHGGDAGEPSDGAARARGGHGSRGAVGESRGRRHQGEE